MPVEITRTVPLQLLTLAQASAIVNLSKRTLRRAISAGRLRAHHLGRSIRIDLEELKRWVKANGAGPVSNASATR
jgi:excisionase family DNA binding protein